MITHTLEQTCDILDSTRNRYGDISLENSQTVACRFRWITELDKNTNREDISAEALLWLKPDAPVEEGTVIRFGDSNFRIRRVTEARRLRGNKVYFKKCLLDKYANSGEGS
jgi:hypothetical protein